MIYVFLADGFEESEAIVTIDLLKRAEYKVVTVSISNSLEVCSTHGIKVIADSLIDNIDTQGLKMIVLPGGMPGTTNLGNSKQLESIISYCVKQKLPIGAICAAPSVLGKMGILKDKNATCYPGFENLLNCKNYTANSVTVDENIVTAKGAGVTVDFSVALIDMLEGNDKKGKEIKAQIQCRD